MSKTLRNGLYYKRREAGITQKGMAEKLGFNTQSYNKREIGVMGVANGNVLGRYQKEERSCM